MSNKIIKMNFPKKEGNEYLDGCEHEIEPIRLYRVNISNKEVYILEYKDLTHSYNDCLTVLSKENGNFYKNPLDSYDERLDILLEHSTPDPEEFSKLNSKIQLGQDIRINDLLNLITDNQIDHFNQNNQFNLPITAASEGGNTPPPIMTAASEGGNTPPPIMTAASEGGNTPPPIMTAASGDGNTPIMTAPIEIDSDIVIGILRKDGQDTYVDYYSFKTEGINFLQFENEPMKMFDYFKDLHKIYTKKISINEDLLNEIVYVENYVHSVNDNLSFINKEYKHYFYVTKILVNYIWQNEIFERSNGTYYSIKNCLADTYYITSTKNLHKNGFDSKFQGFNTFIKHPLEEKPIENNFSGNFSL